MTENYAEEYSLQRSLYLSVNRVPYFHSAAADIFFVLLFDDARSTYYLYR